MKKHKIAVLITCHNRKDKTLQCLKHLHACTLPEDVEFSVFLVDDGSTDGTSNAVATSFPDVELIQGDGMLFWNRGMYRAWSVAETKYKFDAYLWLNDDTLLYSHALMSLLQVAESYQNNCIVTGSVANEQKPEEVIYGGRTRSQELLAQAANVRECSCFNGNIVYVPKKVHAVNGKNDPYFLHELGDFDYGMRASKSGIKSIIAPGILGVCAPNTSKKGNWDHPGTPFLKRMKLLYKPHGINPLEHFVFEKRHYNLTTALFHFLTIHVRAFLPEMWQHKSTKL